MGSLQRKVYVLYILGFILQCSVKWVLLKQRILGTLNIQHFCHSRLNSGRWEKSQNWFKGMRFNWSSPERFSTAVQGMTAEVKLRLADYCHNFLKNVFIVSLSWSFQNWKVTLAAHYAVFVSIKSPVTDLHIFIRWVVPSWHWGRFTVRS